MKRKQLLFNLIFGLAIAFFIISMSLLFSTIKHYYFKEPEPSIEKKANLEDDSYRDVIKYIPTLQAELKKYQLEKYSVVLAALMYQESQGKGGDPMQSSESAGLAPNTIDNPKVSIKQGVKHFHQVVAYGKSKEVDFPTIIQAYNMGLGYISFIAKNGGKHNEKLAKKFSMIQVEKNPTVYDCAGNQDNFRYPYCYGDFSYSTKVIKNIGIITEMLSKKTTADAH